MILNIRHKGLRRFYETGDTRGIQPNWQRKLRLILLRLEVSQEPNDMNIAGFNMHSLHGNMNGFYAVSVTGNWRVVYRFELSNITDVDLLDYH